MTVRELLDVFDSNNIGVEVYEKDENGVNTDLVKIDSRYTDAIRDDILGRAVISAHLKFTCGRMNIFVRKEVRG